MLYCDSVSRSVVSFVAFLLVVVPASVSAQVGKLFDVPLRINMGGPETIDGFGRTWLGDPGAEMDVLNIRPDDAGGANAILDWNVGATADDSIIDLGFDSFGPERSMFSTIRWDDAARAGAFLMEIPLPNGEYLVNMFFNEGCCANRHFKIDIQGTLVDPDVHSGRWGGLHRLGRASYPDIAVTDSLMRITLLPCSDPECPGGTDGNAIINALEILSGEGCDHQGLDFNCTYIGDSNKVDGSWVPQVGADGYRILRNGVLFLDNIPPGVTVFSDVNPTGNPSAVYTLQVLDGGVPTGAQCTCAVTPFACPKDFACAAVGNTAQVDLAWALGSPGSVTGFELRRNGALIATLDATTDIFSETVTTRFNDYELKPLGDKCLPLSCAVVVESLPFDAPLRINMGGRTTVDSKGRTWIGDGPGGGDPLAIRPDDFGGANWIENWCPGVAQAQPETLRSLGFDPNHAGDRYIMTTIRWDDGAAPGEYRLELPIANGAYNTSLYFTECCCSNRHFQVEIQGEIYDDDVSYRDYDIGRPGFGRTGRLDFEGIEVFDGLLRIAMLPCPGCADPAGAIDINAILSAIEIVPAEVILPRCPWGLGATVELGNAVHLSWEAGQELGITGYDLYRNGDKIATLSPLDASYIDTTAGCQRAAVYELVPSGEGVTSFCSGLRLLTNSFNPDCPFATPLRINMGGAMVLDSKGDAWLGDGHARDPLEIRPDDLGGDVATDFWAIGNYQADSFPPLGFDATNAADLYMFTTIRWDNGGQFPDFLMEVPIADGEYTVNMYFLEGCCPARHFKISIQDEILDDDVSYLDYVPDAPALGKLGRLTFPNIVVGDGIMKIGLLPCPECPGATDTNAIIDALEILSTGGPPPSPPTGLTATAGDGKVDLQWNANVPVPKGYDLYRASSPGGAYAKLNAVLLTATQYTDTSVQNGSLYCYVVRAVSNDGFESGNSNEVCATPTAGGVKFRRGDADSSRVLDLTDAVFELNYLFLAGATPTCLDAADVDDSGVIDLTDSVYNLNFQFLAGPPPPAPGHLACDVDPTPDANGVDLGCAEACP